MQDELARRFHEDTIFDKIQRMEAEIALINKFYVVNPPSPSPRALYTKAGIITIGTSETDILNVPIPANYVLGDNLIRWSFQARFQATTTRLITWRYYFDDTLMVSDALNSTGTSTVQTMTVTGTLLSTAAAGQLAQFERRTMNNTAGSGTISNELQGTAAEDVSTEKNLRVTCQLAGAVTSAVASHLIIEQLDGTD